MIAEQMAESLRSRIVERTGGRVRDVRVECVGGQFVVRGRSPSYFLKQLALEATRDLLDAGQISLSLDIQVSQPDRCRRI
jgi:hypothetical protein